MPSRSRAQSPARGSEHRSLAQRTLYFPLEVGNSRLARTLLRVARHLESGALEEALKERAELQSLRPVELVPVHEDQEAPSLLDEPGGASCPCGSPLGADDDAALEECESCGHEVFHAICRQNRANLSCPICDAAGPDSAEPSADSTKPEARPTVEVAALRAEVLASVLTDLHVGGWAISVDGGQVYVSDPAWSVDASGLTPEQVRAEKARVRRALEPRVKAQFEREPVRKFVERMERLRRRGDSMRSVVSLIADGEQLASTLKQHGPKALKPYLQPASAPPKGAERHVGRDPYTGHKLSDIYRYFRYFWSFPAESTPGRSMPFLIRDAGQPNHPVCGLLCLASPVPRLTARDAKLGLTRGWLEAMVAGLDLLESPDPGRHLADLELALRSKSDQHHLRAAEIFDDLARSLGLRSSCRAPRELTRQLRGLSRDELAGRISRARQELVASLMDELRRAMATVSLEGLGLKLHEAVAEPAPAIEQLEETAERALEEWKELCKTDRELPRDDELRESALYTKKRAKQLRSLLLAWQSVLPLARTCPSAASIREHIFGQDLSERWQLERHGLSSGERVARGLRTALDQRRSRIMASQVLDVCVCGAIPPYNDLLGGKLAALLALSGDLAQYYYEQYRDRSSIIESKMSGREIKRPADLFGLTTTSFYSVGSSQYKRLKLELGDRTVRWQEIGHSQGNGTLHFSKDTSHLMQMLLAAETGQRRVTSRFGEGPSERLRKIRDALQLLRLPADDLLNHGLPRIVYVADLDPTGSRPGGSESGTRWREHGPSTEEVAEFWRQRWLKKRLKPELLERLAQSDPVKLSLSAQHALGALPENPSEAAEPPQLVMPFLAKTGS